MLSGSTYEGFSHADLLASVARMWGVEEADIVKAPPALDTSDEAVNMAPVLGPDAFLLVTSASHMPRAMKLFRHQGTHPIAAPTHHLATHGLQLDDVVPGAGPAMKTNAAVHEYLGLFWAKLRGQL
jgi:uncharacterized SAM-binding protein YcdF (DUF218 family)